MIFWNFGYVSWRHFARFRNSFRTCVWQT